MVSLGKIGTLMSIALIGIATYGPDSLICTAGAMDVGGKKGAAMAAGIIKWNRFNRTNDLRVYSDVH